MTSALGGIRTPNLLIRSQMLYPLSYERWSRSSVDEGARASLLARQSAIDHERIHRDARVTERSDGDDLDRVRAR